MAPKKIKSIIFLFKEPLNTATQFNRIELLWQSSVCLAVSVCLSVSMCVSVCLHPSVSICLSICLSVCLWVCLSVYLPASLSTWVKHCFWTIWLSGLKVSFEFVSNLAGTQSHNQISDKCIFCFSTAVTDHHTPATILSQFTPEKKKRESETTNKQHVSTFVELSLPFKIKLGFNWQSHQATRRTVMAPTSLPVFPSTAHPPPSHITHPSFKYYYTY